MALVALARVLVAYVPLGRWRRTLGTAAPPDIGDPALHLATNLPARRLARAVERAAVRLPGESLCLPKAMALQWMLRRRAMDGMLVIGVRSGQERGRLDDLHAWVVSRGEFLIGATKALHHPIYAVHT